ncbi:hypothetical protein Q7439_05880, partial [Glaesserella parasuis]|nr:hypothetical protein [Glaesserella parasuis]
MVGQDPPYKLLPPQVGKSQKYLSPTHCKKKKKKQELHKTKNKITRIFQRLSIKVRNNRRKSNESGDLDRIFVYYAEIIGS